MFNPMTFTESAGIAKVFIQEEKRELSTRLGFGFRQHTNRDVLIDPINDVRETQSTNDGGILSVTDFKTPLAQERILFTSKLTLYKAIFYSEEDALVGLPNEDYWKEVDINWENIFSASITKYLMVNLYTQLLYDKELDLAGRFKETLSLGLTYKFI